MNLKLKRPLVIFDLETTGTNPHNDRIVEISAVKIRPDGSRDSFHYRLNPEQQIPEDSIRIHGITNADVSEAPTFRQIAPALIQFLAGSDLAGFGVIRFDVPLLSAEFRRLGVAWELSDTHIIDAQRIFHLREPRTLGAALQFYCGESHDDAHSAAADALAAFKVLEAQCRHYPDLPEEVAALAELCNPCDPDAVDPDGKLRWQEDEVIIAFGQKSGMSLRRLAADDPGYLRWMLNKDFSAEVKNIVKDAMTGRFPCRRP